MFVSALGWTRGWTWLRKNLLDFNLVGAGSDPNSGCLGSVDWRSLSALLAVSLIISGGTIPASRCRLLVLVGDHSRSVHVAIPVSFAANSASTSCYKFSLYSNQCRAETILLTRKNSFLQHNCSIAFSLSAVLSLRTTPHESLSGLPLSYSRN